MSESPSRNAKIDRGTAMRMLAVALLLVGLFGVVAGRLYHVQVVEYEVWSERAKIMTQQRRVIPALRGMIFDRNGELLAHDRKFYEIWIDAIQMKDFNDIRRRLGRLDKVPYSEMRSVEEVELVRRYQQHIARVLAGGMSSDPQEQSRVQKELLEKFNTETKSEYRLLGGLEEDQYLDWKERVESSGVAAISLRPTVRRFYPGGGKTTHVMGHTSSDRVDESDPDHPEIKRSKQVLVGQAGVEGFFNEQLTGTDGYLWTERDRRGREIAAFRSKTVEPVHGLNVVLSIDMHLQETLENVLDQAYAYHEPKHITGILMDPYTGEILAMANRPSYDRSTLKGVTLNHAISAVYEPGSVFKVVAFAGALDKKLTHFDEMHNASANNPLLISQKLDDHVPPAVTTLDAFSRSSNRVSYLLARKLGRENFLQYVKDFGFGARTGIELRGEVRGVVHELRRWDNLTHSRMAMGHAITVTPIQMVSAVSAIANGGVLMKPTLLREIRDYNGNLVKQFAPAEVRQVIDSRTAEQMRRMMVEVVSGKHGTAKAGAIEGVQVAGKTGTTQKPRLDGPGYDKTRHVASFAGFAPAEKPALSAIIVVDEPTGRSNENTGGRVASPIFAQLMKQSLNTLAVAKANADALRSNTTAKGLK